MKQFIVLSASIALGLFLYQLIAGEGDSILSTLRQAWIHEIQVRTYSP